MTATSVFARLRSRAGDTRRALAVAAVATSLLVACSSCSEPPPAVGAPASPAPVELPPDAQLAANAARAQDQYYTADYSYTPSDGGAVAAVRVERTAAGFLVELAAPADSVSVAHTVTIVDHPAGQYYCRVTAAGGGCVLQSKAGESAAKAEPARMRLAFTRWLRTLAGQKAALSIAAAEPPAGVRGTCFSVEGVAAAMDPPVDAGVYCFDDLGRITGLQLIGGTLAVTAFGAAPATVTLPAPAGALPATAIPPKPSASASASAAAR